MQTWLVMWRHTQERSRIAYECKDCGKLFPSRTHMNHHMLSHTGEKPCLCHLCENQYAQKTSLNRHLRACHFKKSLRVQERINRPSDLQEERQRTDDQRTDSQKPYSWAKCNKTFSVMINLVRLPQTQDNEKPYACRECIQHMSWNDNWFRLISMLNIE